MELLDKLNLPTYETILPFSNLKVKFTPFKVKDAKNISIVLQENDKKLALNALIDCIKNNSNIKNIEHLCLADVEYLFLQIRSKSIDEVLNLIINDKKVKVNISDIKPKNKLSTKTIKINSTVNIELETPTISDLLQLNSFEDQEYTKACFKKLFVGTEIYEIKKFVTDDIKKIIDNLPITIIKEMEQFMDEQPSLFITHTENDAESEVTGFLTFFTWR